jgi:predicted DNA-binding transcriptional regulator AlpA
MAKHDRQHVQPELLSLAQACKRAGIATETAVKLAERGEFPRTSWIGSKRVVGRRAFEAWLAERVGSAPAA